MNDYLVFQVQKSAEKHYYGRVVLKLSTVFSYIGGVIGSCLTVLFFFNNYTSFALEVSIAKEIFNSEKRTNLYKTEKINLDQAS